MVDDKMNVTTSALCPRTARSTTDYNSSIKDIAITEYYMTDPMYLPCYITRDRNTHY